MTKIFKVGKREITVILDREIIFSYFRSKKDGLLLVDFGPLGVYVTRSEDYNG